MSSSAATTGELAGVERADGVSGCWARAGAGEVSISREAARVASDGRAEPAGVVMCGDDGSGGGVGRVGDVKACDFDQASTKVQPSD